LGGLGVSAGVIATSDVVATTTSLDVVELWVELFGAASCLGEQAVLSITMVDKMPNNVLFIA
jgi:hypothetical protein